MIPLLETPLGVREANLSDIGESGAIDAFVRDAAGATPFHLTAWSRAVERGCRQRARYLVAERADGGIAGVLPLTEMRSPLFGKALVSTRPQSCRAIRPRSFPTIAPSRA